MDDGALPHRLTPRPAIKQGAFSAGSRRPGRSRAPLTLGGLFLLCILLPAGLFLASAVERRAAMWEMARRDVEQTTAVLEQLAQRLLETQELVLELTEDLVRGATEEEIASEQTSQRLAEIAQRLPQTVSIWVTDARGMLLAGSQRAPLANNVADQEYFQAQVASPSSRFISRPYLGRITGRLSFAMSRRRPTEDGRFSGTIHVAISPEHIEQSLRVAIADAGGAGGLVRSDGAFIARHPPLRQPSSLPLDGNLMRSIAAQPSGAVVLGTSSVEGTRRLYAHRRVEPFDVHVGYGTDLPLREAAWRAAVLRDAALAGLSSLLLCGAAWFTWRSMRARSEANSALRAESERRHAVERQLEQARSLEALGRMARGVAHDFNNLLTVVIGNLETLQDQSSDPGVRSVAARSRKAAEAGAALAASLLAYARTQMLKVEPVRIGALLEDARPLLQDLATPSVQVAVEVEPGLPRCLCDVAQFRAALGNLVSNARDAMPSGGRILVSARLVRLEADDVPPGSSARPGRFVAVSVADNGTGMSSEVVARAFEPFFTTKAPGAGSGLGLSHVFGLVSQLEGHVALRSGLGQGTTITLHLPAVDLPQALPAAERSPLARPTVPPGVGERRRILVVDDRAEIRQLTRTILSRGGYAVEVAGDGAEAIAQWERGPRFDLLLTDVVLGGGGDGLALLRRFRESDPGLPGLLMTGYAPDVTALDAAGAAVLAKPFSRDALLGAVRTALESGAVTATGRGPA